LEPELGSVALELFFLVDLLGVEDAVVFEFLCVLVVCVEP
jgi:hypothetical protein